MYTLYDIETQIPTFFHITTAAVHDSKIMDESLTKQVLIIYLTEDATTSKAFFGLRTLVLILLLGQSQTYSLRPNVGNIGYRKMYCLMLLEN